jgi:hypothetical protein
MFECNSSADRRFPSNKRQKQRSAAADASTRSPRTTSKHCPTQDVPQDSPPEMKDPRLSYNLGSTNRRSPHPPFPRENSDPLPRPTTPSSWGSNNPFNIFLTESEPELHSCEPFPTSQAPCVETGEARGSNGK